MSREMRKISAISVALALLVSHPASAESCWNKDALVAAQVRELHLMLMTVMLRCRAITPSIIASYDQFLSKQKRAISDAETRLMEHFGAGKTGAGRANFERFHTNIANFYGIGKTDQQSCTMFDVVAQELAKADATAATMAQIAGDMVPEPRIDGPKCVGGSSGRP